MEPLFAWLHFVAMLALGSTLVAELVLCTASLRADQLTALLRIDSLYLLAAIAVLATGLARLIWFAKGPGFYLSNPSFQIKVGLFIAIGLLSLPPTRHYMRWRRAARDGHGDPPPAEIAHVHRYLVAELVLLAAMPLLASLMARGIAIWS